MGNLSKIKRERMLGFIEQLKEANKDNDDNIKALNEIASALDEKRYGLVWEEHTEKVDELLHDNVPVFIEDVSKKINCNEHINKYNFLIEGDNLHSLYLLEKTHKNAVDIIYIDPPYNTGNNDFIYNDNMIVGEDGFKHSKWLSFMNKRLRIARNILSKKGFILISIDDNEYSNLKLLCDSIFDERNYIGTFIKQSKVGGGSDSKFVVKEHEYVLIYCKNSSMVPEFFIEHDDDYLKRYKEKDEKGRFFWDTFARPGLKHPIVYDIIAPDGTVINNGWIHSKARFEEELANGDVRIIKSKNGWSVQFKQYLNSNGKKPRSMTMDFGGTIDGKNELKSVFNNDKVFQYPKSAFFIKTLLKMIDSKNSIILDFFAGSGTTGQAVLELNQEDGGHRSFILCTNNENDICTNVTYQRLKTVITGVRNDGSKYSDGIKANLKYFKTDFVSRNDEFLKESLLEHINEMIELENGIEIDNKEYIVLLSDDDVDDIEKKWANYNNVKCVFLSSDCLLTESQKKMFKGIKMVEIPDYYFDFEIREAE